MMTDARVMSIDELKAFLSSSDGEMRVEMRGHNTYFLMLDDQV